jgi:hypothetical protein
MRPPRRVSPGLPAPRAFLFAAIAAAALGPAACATYSDDLTRAQRAFEGSEDERALAIMRVLEPDTSRLSDSDRAHYAYLRGMTDYRIGYKLEARHWLSLAASMEQHLPGSLPPEWAKHLEETLKELNEEVYTAGIESLANTAAAKPGAGSDNGVPSTDTAPSMPPSDSTPAKSKPKPADD